MLQQLALSVKNRKGKKIKKEDVGGNLGSYARVCFPEGFGRTGCLVARVILLSMIHLSPLITCLQMKMDKGNMCGRHHGLLACELLEVKEGKGKKNQQRWRCLCFRRRQ